VVRVVELKLGTWLDESLDEEVREEAQALCHVLESRIADAALCLGLFEGVAGRRPRVLDQAEWERDAHARSLRNQELEAERQPSPTDPRELWEWRNRISTDAARDVARARWERGELPDEYQHQLPFLHARGFLTSLAQVERALRVLGRLDLGEAKAEVIAAREALEEALPGLRPARDSIEHAEDRMRGRGRGNRRVTLAPITNKTAIHAPGGGLLVSEMLNGPHYGCTAEDGTLVEVEVSEATLEAARVAVQRVFDALPWHEHGYPRYSPSS
jgi:hypothetical protein